jgi:hypothetical protein
LMTSLPHLDVHHLVFVEGGNHLHVALVSVT